MSYVASDTKTHALSQMLPQSGRPSHSADRGAADAFESLLDTPARPAPERPERPDRPDRPEQRERSERPEHAGRQGRQESQAADRPQRPDRPEKTDNRDAKAAKDDTRSDETPAARDEAMAGEPVSKADEAKPAETAEQKPAETEIAAQPAMPEAALQLVKAIVTPAADMLAPPAAVVDPAAAATTDGEATAANPATIAATQTKPAVAAAVAAEQIATPVLSQEEAEALAALQAKAVIGGKASPDDKTDTKADADKPGVTAKAATPVQTPVAQATQTLPLTENDEAAAPKPAHHAELAKIASEQARGASDEATVTDKSATASTTLNATSPKAPDSVLPNVLPQAPQHAAAQTAAPAAAAAVTAQRATADAPVPISGLAFEISSKALAGKNQFDIRLDPADLGRIHVRLDVDRDGNVITHMIADRTDTLDLLRRDTAGLERALQDAGLKTSDNSLQFSLRDQSGQQQNNESGNEIANLMVEDEQHASAALARDYGRYGLRAGGLDIRV